MRISQGFLLMQQENDKSSTLKCSNSKYADISQNSESEKKTEKGCIHSSHPLTLAAYPTHG